MAYSTLDSAFFQLLCQKALSIPIDQGVEREIERRQMVRLMSLFAEIFLSANGTTTLAAVGWKIASNEVKLLRMLTSGLGECRERKLQLT